MEECLKICQHHNQTEACAFLSKKLGTYLESVQYYIQYIDQNLDI